MQLNPELLPPRCPGINLSKISEEHKDVGRAIRNYLSTLETEATNFVSAVALFEHCIDSGSQDLYGRWTFIAGREGALTIRNFGKAMKELRSTWGRIPEWRSMIDGESTINAAWNSFELEFPFADRMRHVVAHPELYDNPKKKMGVDGENIVSSIHIGPNATNVSIRNCFQGSLFQATFEGAFVEYDLSISTVNTINRLTTQAFSAFGEPDQFGSAIFPPF